MESKTTRGGHDEALIDGRKAAEVLRISTRKLWNLANEGAIRCVRIGRAVRYDPADLRAFIERSKGGRS